MWRQEASLRVPPVAINYRGPNPPDPLRRVAPTYPHPSFAGSFPSFAGPDRRISHCQGHRRPFLPRATQNTVRQGQIRAILPLGGCCRAQNGVLVCPGNEIKASREQIRLFLCPARTHFRPVLPAEAAGLRLSTQKNACPAAPCRSRRRRIGVQKIAILRSFFWTPPPGFCRNAVSWPTGVHFYCTRGRFCGYLSLLGMQDSCRGIINEESQSISTGFLWSGKRGSDPRPQPWQGCALPTELFPQNPIA